MAKVALLIDADNLSSAGDVQEAFGRLEAMGLTVTVRRAYGGLDKLAGIKEVLRAFAVRSFINQGKGTTDVALVVDAMDLLYNDSLPASVAIASSDADFAPLALRLREAGMRVICFARREKSDDDALGLAYDEVVYVGTEPKRPRASSVPAPAAAAKVPSAAAKAPSAAKRAPAKKAAVKKAAPAPKPAAKASTRKAGTASAEVTVEGILAVIPALKTGNPVRLDEVAKPLHDAHLLGRNTGSPRLFKKFAQDFTLSPASEPQFVQWNGSRGR